MTKRRGSEAERIQTSERYILGYCHFVKTYDGLLKKRILKSQTNGNNNSKIKKRNSFYNKSNSN